MKKLFLCFLILISCTTYAVDPIDFATATPAEVRSYNLKRQQEYIQKTDKSFADLGKKINQVKASVDGPHIKQVLEQAGVLSDGSKVNVKTVVTQTPNKTKVAQVLTERLKNAKDYAKNLGKASIPSFVGMAAFHGLMEGIDWVMGEGGQVVKVEKPHDDGTLHPDYQYRCYGGGFIANTATECGNIIAPGNSIPGDPLSVQNCGVSNTVWCTFRYQSGSTYSSPVADRIQRLQPMPEATETNVSDQELEQAIKNALESNNPALAAAIADAIKSAYSYDASEGQKPSSNTLAKEAADDMAVALPKAFDNPVPTSNPERPSGYYKITDGDKTVEGYVTPAPIGGTTDTTTTPTIDPVTGQPTGGTSTTGGFQLPAFCDWAAVVCDFIDWVKEEPEIDEPEVPFKDIQRQEIRDDLLTIGSTACPADIQVNWTGLPFGISIDKTVEMRPYCDVLEPLKYVFSLLTICLCAFMFLRL